MKAIINQQNFFQSYCPSNTYYSHLKKQVVNLAQQLKQVLSDNYKNKAVLALLSKLAIAIQHNLNRGQFTLAEIDNYHTKLSATMMEYKSQQRDRADYFFKCCIVLAKHHTKQLQVTNYFGITNQTTSLRIISISEYRYPNVTAASYQILDRLLRRFLPDKSVQAMAIDKLAQVKIVKVYQDYLNKALKNTRSPDRPYLSSSEKTIIIACMEIIGAFYWEVPSAQQVNNDSNWSYNYSKLESMRDIEAFRFKKGSATMAKLNFVTSHIGNCSEIALVLWLLIKYHASPLLNFIKDNISICHLTEPDDHTFLVIGNPQSPHSVVIDGWLKFVDLKPISQYRQSTSFAINRKRGFIGPMAIYLRYLYHHADGMYVIKNRQHFVEKDFITDETLKRIKLQCEKVGLLKAGPASLAPII